MATKKAKNNYYYVLVLTDNGPVFVTGEGEHKTCYWNKEKDPMEFSKNYAEQMTLGLCVNGHMAFCVAQPFEIDHQPYLYKKGHLEWVWNDEEATDNNEEKDN